MKNMVLFSVAMLVFMIFAPTAISQEYDYIMTDQQVEFFKMLEGRTVYCPGIGGGTLLKCGKDTGFCFVSYTRRGGGNIRKEVLAVFFERLIPSLTKEDFSNMFEN